MSDTGGQAAEPAPDPALFTDAELGPRGVMRDGTFIVSDAIHRRPGELTDAELEDVSPTPVADDIAAWHGLSEAERFYMAAVLAAQCPAEFHAALELTRRATAALRVARAGGGNSS